MIAPGDGLALFNFLVEVVKLGQHDGALQGIHTTTDSDASMYIAFALAMHSNFSAGLRQDFVIGEDGTTIAIAAERLAGKEAGTTKCAEVAALLTFVGRAEALGCVFNDGDVAVAGSDGIDLFQVGRLTIETDRHDGFGLGGDLDLDQACVNVAGVWIDVDEHWGGANQDDNLDGCDESEGGRDNFITRADTQRHQADQ